MPELPEVETVRRGLAPVMEGARLQTITINRHDVRGGIPMDFSQTLTGASVHEPLIRRGKYIVIPSSHDVAIILHLGMSGRVKIHKPDEVYQPEKHDHAVFTTDQGVTIVYNDARRFGMLYYADLEAWQDNKPFAAMGPEPLGNYWNGAALYDRVQNTSRVSIKAALLDQRVVAGVGNIYACEALYRSRIHPERFAASLSVSEADTLCRSVKDVLNEAIAAGGSTLRDHAQTDGSMGYFQHQFDVYDRAGSVCPRCREACVSRLVQNGRSSFYCKNTQIT